MNTKFSIIIASYNTASYISTCINSILSQTFKDYEIIVVDDCSSDDGLTLKTLNKFPTIKLFHTTKNSGPGATRNLGISKANGQYIIFLDSDDTLATNDTLEKLNCTINQDIPDIIYTGFQFVGEDFHFIPNALNCTKEYRLAKNKFINVWSICWNTQFIKANNIRFPESCYSYEDVPFAFLGISLASKYKIADYITYNYTRNRPNSSSTRASNPTKHFNQSRDTITCIESLYRLKDLINPNDKDYLLQRINEQKSRLPLRIDRALKDLIEGEKNDDFIRS